MAIILGYITLISLLLTVAKFPAKRLRNPKLNRFFWKLHKPASGIFFIACIVHLILAMPVLKTRSIWVIGSGLIGLVVSLLLIGLCHTMKDREKKMSWHRKMSLVLILLAAVHVITYFIDFAEYKQKIEEITIQQPDVSIIPNGTYTGEYDAGYIYAKVQVTVREGKIEAVKILEHRTERGKKAESIADAIVKEQWINVDAVTGATNSSLVIKKACEDALRLNKNVSVK